MRSSTFYPCRHVDAEHPMLHAPQAGKTNRFRTKRPTYQHGRALDAWPKKFTGASTNLQRFKLLSFNCVAQISDAMSRAPSGIIPSSR